MRSRALRLALLASLSVLVGACTKDICSRHSDCASGQVCTPEGTCSIAPDAGADDGDGGTTDGGGGATSDATSDAAIDGG